MVHLDFPWKITIINGNVFEYYELILFFVFNFYSMAGNIKVKNIFKNKFYLGKVGFVKSLTICK